MGKKKSEICHDCNAKPGEFHKPGCDVERCPNCGGQAISCGCSDKDFESAPRMKWTGMWPGEAECIEFGWYCKMVAGKGWTPCDKDDPEARTNLNRLYEDAVWNKELQRFVKKPDPSKN